MCSVLLLSQEQAVATNQVPVLLRFAICKTERTFIGSFAGEQPCLAMRRYI